MEKIKLYINNVCNYLKKKYANLSILDKYIIKQMLEVFALGVIVFTSIVFASETFTQLMKQISLYGIPFNIAIMIIVLNLPQIFVMTIPISTLFAVIMTINDLSLKSEITVLKACGIGISRIAKPVFVFAVVMTVTSLFINEFIVPATSKQAQYLGIYSLQKKHIPEGKKNYTLKDSGKDQRLRRLIYVQECKDKELKNVTLIDLSDVKMIRLIQAKAGTTNRFGWVFKDAIAYTISTEDKVFNTALFDNSTINFGLDNIDGIFEDNTSQYNYFKLLKYIEKNKNNPDFQGKVQRQYLVELHDKVALPMTTFALALVGIPLAITPPRVRYNRGFLFSILIIFIFYLIRAFSLNLGEAGVIAPFLAAWLPVLTILLIGIILYRKKAYSI